MLVVAQFGAPALFAHSLIGPLEIVNKLNFSKAKQSSLAELYLDASEKTLFLIFNDEIPPMKEVYFSKFLEKNIKSERIILLMSVNKSTLQESNCPALTVPPSSFRKFPQLSSKRSSTCLTSQRVSMECGPMSWFGVKSTEFQYAVSWLP